jgi:hypothetical protein
MKNRGARHGIAPTEGSDSRRPHARIIDQKTNSNSAHKELFRALAASSAVVFGGSAAAVVGGAQSVALDQ